MTARRMMALLIALRWTATEPEACNEFGDTRTKGVNIGVVEREDINNLASKHI